MSFYVSTATFFLLHCDEWDRVVALPRHKFVTGATLLQLTLEVQYYSIAIQSRTLPLMVTPLVSSNFHYLWVWYGYRPSVSLAAIGRIGAMLIITTLLQFKMTALIALQQWYGQRPAKTLSDIYDNESHVI